MSIGFSSVVVAQSTSLVPQVRTTDATVLSADSGGTGLVPCTDTCGFNDVITLINNIITFLITQLFIPIVILLFVYAGFKYITAQGNPAKVANIKKMVLHIVLGMILVLCSWLIVKTVLGLLLRQDATSGTLLQ